MSIRPSGIRPSVPNSSHTDQIIREEMIKTKRIQKLIKDFLIEKLRLETIYAKPSSVYIDESVIHNNYVNKKTSQPINDNKVQKMNKTVGKGVCFTVINAISEDGFVKNGELIIYKTEINSQLFEEYLEKQLMPELPPNSIVIYDNCSVHSRRYIKTPTQSTNIESIKEWLNDNNIYFDYNLKKKDLLEIVRQNPIRPRYYVDDIVRKFGCHPLRLPPYCCHLNPIEMIWNTWKQIVGHKNFKNNLEEYRNLLSNSFNEITSSTVENTIRKVVRDVESKYFQQFNISSLPNDCKHNYFFNCSHN